MRSMLGPALAIACLATVLSTPQARAQDTVRVRGTIEKVEGDVLLVKSREGAELKVKLAPNVTVAATVKAALGDIKTSSYIGVAGHGQTDGSQRAIEVHIFHETMRGTAEGFRPWDLQPQSSMTNATVESTVSGVDGQTILLKYKDGEKKIIVPPGTLIVAFVPGTMEDLKAGAGIFIGAAAKQPDGTLQAGRITVGREIAPPL
jgi:hypothetical protein